VNFFILGCLTERIDCLRCSDEEEVADFLCELDDFIPSSQNPLLDGP
jgi:hypothetical protein